MSDEVAAVSVEAGPSSVDALPSAPPDVDAGSLPGSVDVTDVDPVEEVGVGGHTNGHAVDLHPLPSVPVARHSKNAVYPALPHDEEELPGGTDADDMARRHPITTDPTPNETDTRINSLLNTLECPVCLDVADRAPIYQCPEGHLLCDSCNARLVDCPQCGHALMNSRNRTAEDLASKLQSLRGDRRDGYLPSQALSISVSQPQKIRKGLFSYMVYSIVTCVGSGEGGASAPTYSVTRRYSEIAALYEQLLATYLPTGVIVPPPPPKSSLTILAAVPTDPNTTSTSININSLVGKRCLALDRYFKRLVTHPLLRKDPNFRAFIQEKTVPKTTMKGKTMNEKWSSMVERFSLLRSKLTVTEHDPWFQTKQVQLKTLSKQLSEMERNLHEMSLQKRRLFAVTGDFQRGLVSMLVSRPARESQLASVMAEVVACHKAMGVIHVEQARADELVAQLAADYRRMGDAAMHVLAQRKGFLLQMQRLQKGKNALEAIEKVQGHFDKFSQTIRRELEHMDFVMREEFRDVFDAYNVAYWQAISRTDSWKKQDSTDSNTH